jgi:hypothetical protein
MSKAAGKTKDETIKQWPEATAPANTFASASMPDMSTFPAELDDRSVSGDNTDGRLPSSLPYGGETEYVAPPSNLPMTVSAEESRRHICEWQSQNPWVSETENAPILAGTRSGTPSAAPVADFSGSKIGESLAQGSVSGIIEGLLSDSFDALRKRGGGGA